MKGYRALDLGGSASLSAVCRGIKLARAGELPGAIEDAGRAKRIAGALGVPSRSTLGEGHVDIAALERSMIGLPGVVEDGMPGANEQRKPGTARGSPRRSRTAKASRISRHAVKSRCAREWVGWGRLSDDGPGHYNPDPSEGPWGGGDST